MTACSLDCDLVAFLAGRPRFLEQLVIIDLSVQDSLVACLTVPFLRQSLHSAFKTFQLPS